MAFPSSLRILGRDWKVRKKAGLKDDDGGPACGLTLYDKQVIEIATNQLPIDSTDTLVHEVFHAIRHCQGREQGGDIEEDYVRSLATGLVGVLSDNPQFAKWLLTQFTPTK